MSYVNVVPDTLAAAAADVAAIGSGISAAQASAAAATTVVSPAALDEVSIAVSTAFSEFGTQLQDVYKRQYRWWWWCRGVEYHGCWWGWR